MCTGASRHRSKLACYSSIATKTTDVKFKKIKKCVDRKKDETSNQSFPFDACDHTPTRCHTRRITYECYLSHGQNSEGIIYLLSLFITSKRL